MKHELPKYHVILEFFFFFLSHLFHHTKQKQSKGFHPLKETRRIIYLNEKKKKKHFSRFFSKTRWLKIVTPNSSYRKTNGPFWEPRVGLGLEPWTTWIHTLSNRTKSATGLTTWQGMIIEHNEVQLYPSIP